jgi:uncharacterized protein (DUF58 family)
MPEIETQTTEQLDHEFDVAVRRLADDLRFGQDASPYLGSGIEYVQSRTMVDGDSVRAIDWRVTARTGRLHVKEYEALKAMPMYLVVDTSGSMAIGSRTLTKHRLATLIAGGLGLASLRRLSPVGVLAGGDRKLHFQPSLNRGRMFLWLHELRRADESERTCLGQRLDQLESLLDSRSLVIAISDLHDPAAIPAAKRIAQRHDTILIHLQDPSERGAWQAGFFHAIEAETGRRFVAHGRSTWFAETWTSARRELAAARVDYLPLSTDQPFVSPLRRLLADRGGLGRSAR